MRSHGREREGARRTATLAALAAAVTVASAFAETRAGTVIVNTATLRHGDGATISNTAAVIVAERLDVALAADPAAASGTVAVILTNRGNGDEAFVVDVSASGGGVAGAPGIVLDGGAPVALHDGVTPPIAPGVSATILVPVPAAGVDAALTVTVRAATGSGTPGDALAGRGDGGGDAVVGPTGGRATLTVPLAAPPGRAPTLAKSQQVIAPDGSATPTRGARIAYTLVARFAEASEEAAIVDPIPAGTTLLPGSIALDGRPLADADHLAAARLTVPLGAVAAGETHTLRFTVVIS